MGVGIMHPCVLAPLAEVARGLTGRGPVDVTIHRPPMGRELGDDARRTTHSVGATTGCHPAG